MTAYDFKCPQCGATTEVKAAMDEAYVFPWCPRCQIQMKRDYSVPNIQFKGQGFYTTDKGR